MTVNAEAHLEFHGHQAIHFFHLSVTYRTVDAARDMPLMIELNVVRYVGDPDPRDGSLGLVMPFYAEDLGML